MEFLNPSALLGALLLPLLLIPYLIRRKPTRLLFSSLLFLRELSSRSQERPWGRLRLPPLFFLQLLLLLLLILALGEPVFSVRPSKIAVILDNSASMQALEGEKSRFALAQERARELLGGLSASAQVDLYVTTPALAQLGAKGLSPSAAAALVAGLAAYDLGEPRVDYGQELSRLEKEKGYERLFFITDRPGRGSAGAIRLIAVGRPRDNLAIASFRVRRGSFASTEREATIEIKSFSLKDEKVKLSLKAGGRVLASRELQVAAGRSVATSFETVPPYPAYEAEIEASDALALDNRRFAIAPLSRGLEILAVSPRPQALASLRSVSGLSLRAVAPDAYAGAGEDHSVEIFHFSAPAALPRKPALFILPPRENPVVGVGGFIAEPTISAWREPHPLTRYINFTLFRPAYGRVLKPLGGESVIESPEGALAVALEREGVRYLALGFDPFPYLGRENLPMSIFTLNLLDWLHEGAAPSDRATGEPLALGEHAGAILLTPKGERVALGQGQKLFAQTFFQGLYELARGREKEIFALNLRDLAESDLHNPAPIELRGEPPVSHGALSFFPLWPYLLFLSLVLLFLEWFLSRRASQP
jgi:hypothetical protein